MVIIQLYYSRSGPWLYLPTRHILTCTCIVVLRHLQYMYMYITPTRKCQLVFEDSIVNATSSNVRLETDGEKEELQIFSDEATNWIRLSGVLMETCIQQHRHKMDEEEKRREEEERVLEEEGSSDGTDTSDEVGVVPIEGGRGMVCGRDRMHRWSLDWDNFKQ